MWSEQFWMGGMWIFPFIMLIVMLFVVFRIFGRGNIRQPWEYDDRNYKSTNREETSLEVLKKRYANGEISKEEFDEIKRDIL